jgi:hypothetical protein
VNAEALLIAAGQNAKRLLAFGERGPRRPAQVVFLPCMALVREAYQAFRMVSGDPVNKGNRRRSCQMLGYVSLITVTDNSNSNLVGLRKDGV